MTPSRRDALRFGGTTLALLAGCLDSATPGRTNESNATATESTARPSSDVRIRRTTVVPELVALDSPDSIAAYGERDEQFVVAQVTADGDAPVYDSFTLEADGDVYTATSDVILHNRLWDGSHRYDDDRGLGFVVFRLPKPTSTDGATVTWPGGAAPLTDENVERLRRAPTTFEVRAFDAPASVESGSEVTLTVEVANVGETDGTFVGALNRIGPDVAYTPVTELRLDVPAGETVTWDQQFTPTVMRTDGTETTRRMALRMHCRGSNESTSVDVVAR